MIEIAVSVITGVLTLAGVIITVVVGGNKNMAVMDTRLEELTREVREHNNFARRLPVVENEIEHINSRLDKLEVADGDSN